MSVEQTDVVIRFAVAKEAKARLDRDKPFGP